VVSHEEVIIACELYYHRVGYDTDITSNVSLGTTEGGIVVFLCQLSGKKWYLDLIDGSLLSL